MEEQVKKMIIIEDCLECPKFMRCKPSRALTPGQRFTVKTGVGLGKFILKGCPLEDVPLKESTANESI